MALALLIISGILFWKARSNGFYTALGAFAFLALAYRAPIVLDVPERWWMKFAEKLSVVTTFLLVALSFFLLITPMAALMRALGKDLLALKLEKDAESYWRQVEEEGPGTRPYLPY